jgi:hypothetical protein
MGSRPLDLDLRQMSPHPTRSRQPRLPGITEGALRSIVALFLFTALIGAGNLIWTAHEVQVTAAGQSALRATSDRRWCHLLRLLTPEGGPKPATATGREFVAAFVLLRREFGC